MATHNYPPGARVRGKVRNLTSYGAFIELEEGIDGMVHVSDMSWTRKINHPSEMVKKGDEVDAEVVDVDVDNQRISLGMKQLTQDPWADIDRLYKMGDVIKGKVARVAGYGAFIQLEHDIDGLVHISQISEDRVEKVKDHLSEGDEVSARVIKIDKEERRIGLSIKAADYDEDALAKEVGAKIGVTRERIRQLQEQALRQLRKNMATYQKQRTAEEIEEEKKIEERGRILKGILQQAKII